MRESGLRPADGLGSQSLGMQKRTTRDAVKLHHGWFACLVAIVGRRETVESSAWFLGAGSGLVCDVNREVQFHGGGRIVHLAGTEVRPLDCVNYTRIPVGVGRLDDLDVLGAAVAVDGE